MASFRDLQPLSYFGGEHELLRAVGWLGADQDFQKGAVAPELVEKLKSLLREPFQPVAFAGPHECELCQFDAPSGSSNVFVPGDGIIYVMPELAIHYMAAHHYKPPEEFQQAVLDCPPMGTLDYRRAFLQNGGRSLIAPAG